MPAAKMVADSTQSDSALERKKRRRDDKDYHKKNKRDGNRSKHNHSPHRNSSSSKRSAGSHSEKSSQKEEDSDNSDMDLSKPLKPIGSYIKNRSEMLDQMLHCIKGSTLKSAIPEELKCMSYPELKQHCLAQLEVMSKKRILRILAGDDPSNISSSGTEESGDDLENTDKKITLNPQESTQQCSNAESHPADSTSSSSTAAQRIKFNINTNSSLSLVSPSSDSHLLPRPVTMPNLDNQSLNIQVAGYSLQTMGTGVSTSCPESATVSSHWLQHSDQPSVISLPTRAGQLQSRPHVAAHLLPPYRHALEVDCSDFPINITPAQTRKGKNVSVLSSLQPHYRHVQPKTQQRNATSSVRPFACSGSDYCICGRCSLSALLPHAAVTTTLGVAANNMIAGCSDTHTPAISGSSPGGGITAKEQVVPTRILARTQMEILELEMRARAIKAMLQAASQCRPLEQQQPQSPSSL